MPSRYLVTFGSDLHKAKEGFDTRSEAIDFALQMRGGCDIVNLWQYGHHSTDGSEVYRKLGDFGAPVEGCEMRHPSYFSNVQAVNLPWTRGE